MQDGAVLVLVDHGDVDGHRRRGRRVDKFHCAGAGGAVAGNRHLHVAVALQHIASRRATVIGGDGVGALLEGAGLAKEVVAADILVHDADRG